MYITIHDTELKTYLLFSNILRLMDLHHKVVLWTQNAMKKSKTETIDVQNISTI